MSCLRVLGVVLLLLLASSPASAQCFGPDNLNAGPCCAPTAANLPPFFSVTMPGLGACWDRCTQGLQRTLNVAWPTLNQFDCGRFSTPLTVSDQASGLPIMTGTMILDYTRTWAEVDPAGTPIQVWRFVAKADLQSVPGGIVVNCPQPPCIAPVGPHTTAYFYGYVDYASCGAGTPQQNAIVLFHNCDRFIHQPGFSDKPGLFHPGQSYAIIAPHSAVQPFIPGNTIAPGGPVIAEATRNVGAFGPGPGPCMVEDRVANGSMTKLGAGCICALTQNPKQQTSRQFLGSTTCPLPSGVGGNWTSLNVNFPLLPWLHMVTSSIGTWSNSFVYPGKEQVWVDEGLFVRQDGCTGDFVELRYGASTRGGWTATLPGPLTVTNFTDLADNWSAPLLGPYPFPINGSVMPTDHLSYVNEP